MNQPGTGRAAASVLMADPRPVILEQWTTDLRRNALYLVGEVSGEPRVRDGTVFRTGRVKWLRADLGIAHTEDGVYILRDRL